MKTHGFIWSLVVLVLSARADDVVLQSYYQNGSLSFSEISNAVNYRIEWSPQMHGFWTNFSGDLGQWMDAIPASGTGTITAAVPMFYRVVASLPPTGMVYIPAGTFMMGNATNALPEAEGGIDELPQHPVYLDGFFIDKYEVTEDVWLNYAGPASLWFGYSFSNLIISFHTDYPARHNSWYDAVKWCNARSQIEGLMPVYYTDTGMTNVYKTGQVDPYVDWSASGYRLPTEAEWEKAARGGEPDLRFAWNDYTNKISHEKANYYAGFQNYDLSSGSHPTYGGLGSPVGSFAPNGYGVYDVAGNAWEWCNDWFDAGYYILSPGMNPLGPTNGTEKVVRGGNYIEDANHARCAFRRGYLPEYWNIDAYSEMGFRCVRKQ